MTRKVEGRLVSHTHGEAMRRACGDGLGGRWRDLVEKLGPRHRCWCVRVAQEGVLAQEVSEGALAGEALQVEDVVGGARRHLRCGLIRFGSTRRAESRAKQSATDEAMAGGRCLVLLSFRALARRGDAKAGPE